MEGALPLDGRRYQAAMRALRKGCRVAEDAYEYPKIYNVVSTVHVLGSKQRASGSSTRGKRTTQTSLDLLSIVRHVPTARYEADVFPAVVLRCCKKTTALVFASGRVVVVSASGPEAGLFTAHMYRLFLEEVPMLMRSEGQIVNQPMRGRLLFSDWMVQNIVAAGSVGHRIELSAVEKAIRGHCVYRPELFPGLMLKMKPFQPEPGDDPKRRIRVLLFDTGKVLIVGARRLSASNRILFRLRRWIQRSHVDRSTTVPRHQRFQARLDQAYTDPAHLESLRRKRPELYEHRKRIHAASFKDYHRQPSEADCKTEASRRPSPSLLDQADELGFTRIMKSAILGQARNVATWIELGDDPRARDAKGRTAWELIQDYDDAKHDAVRDVLRLAGIH